MMINSKKGIKKEPQKISKNNNFDSKQQIRNISKNIPPRTLNPNINNIRNSDIDNLYVSYNYSNSSNDDDNTFKNVPIPKKTQNINQSNQNIYSKDVFIYAWGRNNFGELGLGTNNDTFTPTGIKSFKSEQIKSISSGGKNSLILTEDGKVYISGSNMFGLLGNNPSDHVQNEKFQNKFKIMEALNELNDNIIQVSCAEFHSLCLNDEGNIYAWGGNKHNKLGQTGGVLGQPMKVASLLNIKITYIACGDYHSCAISENGELFSWGGGGAYNRGQCGQGNFYNIDSPKRVSFFKNTRVVRVSCGGYHTIAEVENGDIYGFGKGEYGQTGLGESSDSAIPKKINFDEKMLMIFEREKINEEKNNIKDNNRNNLLKIKDIKCGGEHSVILSSFGRVYVFGHGYTGQLGLGDNKNYYTPIIVKSLTNKVINQIAAGWSHTMVLSSEGNLYVTGCGKYGELGLDCNNNSNNYISNNVNDVGNRYNFTLLKNASCLNITNIFAGGHHSWLICDNIIPVREFFDNPEPLLRPNFNNETNNKNSNKKSVSNKYKINDNVAEREKEQFEMNKDIYNAINNNNLNQYICTRNDTSQEDHNDLTGRTGGFNYHDYNDSDSENDQSNENSQFKDQYDLSSNENTNRSINVQLQINIIYSNLDLSHRSVRFSIHKSNTKFWNTPFKVLDSMIKDYLSKNESNIYYRLQDDKNLMSDSNNKENYSPLFEIINREIGCKEHNEELRSFTLTIINDYNKNKQISGIKEQFKDMRKEGLNNKAFSVKIINQEQIAKDMYENILSGWIFDFFNNFYELFIINNVVNKEGISEIIAPKFIELRPNYFANAEL